MRRSSSKTRINRSFVTALLLCFFLSAAAAPAVVTGAGGPEANGNGGDDTINIIIPNNPVHDIPTGEEVKDETKESSNALFLRGATTGTRNSQLNRELQADINICISEDLDQECRSGARCFQEIASGCTTLEWNSAIQGCVPQEAPPNLYECNCTANRAWVCASPPPEEECETTECQRPANDDGCPTPGGLSQFQANSVCPIPGTKCPIQRRECPLYDENSDSCVQGPVFGECTCTDGLWDCNNENTGNCAPCQPESACPASTTTTGSSCDRVGKQCLYESDLECLVPTSAVDDAGNTVCVSIPAPGPINCTCGNNDEWTCVPPTCAGLDDDGQCDNVVVDDGDNDNDGDGDVVVTFDVDDGCPAEGLTKFQRDTFCPVTGAPCEIHLLTCKLYDAVSDSCVDTPIIGDCICGVNNLWSCVQINTCAPCVENTACPDPPLAPGSASLTQACLKPNKQCPFIETNTNENNVECWGATGQVDVLGAPICEQVPSLPVAEGAMCTCQDVEWSCPDVCPVGSSFTTAEECQTLNEAALVLTCTADDIDNPDTLTPDVIATGTCQPGERSCGSHIVDELCPEWNEPFGACVTSKVTTHAVPCSCNGNGRWECDVSNVAKSCELCNNPSCPADLAAGNACSVPDLACLVGFPNPSNNCETWNGSECATTTDNNDLFVAQCFCNDNNVWQCPPVKPPPACLACVPPPATCPASGLQATDLAGNCMSGLECKRAITTTGCYEISESSGECEMIPGSATSGGSQLCTCNSSGAWECEESAPGANCISSCEQLAALECNVELDSSAPGSTCAMPDMVCPFDSGVVCDVLDAATGECVPRSPSTDCVCDSRGVWVCSQPTCQPCQPLPLLETCPTDGSGGITLNNANQPCTNEGENCAVIDSTCDFWDADAKACLPEALNGGCTCSDGAWFCLVPNCQPCVPPAIDEGGEGGAGEIATPTLAPVNNGDNGNTDNGVIVTITLPGQPTPAPTFGTANPDGSTMAPVFSTQAPTLPDGTIGTFTPVVVSNLGASDFSSSSSSMQLTLLLLTSVFALFGTLL